jgi:Tol biopolymer transport system component
MKLINSVVTTLSFVTFSNAAIYLPEEIATAGTEMSMSLNADQKTLCFVRSDATETNNVIFCSNKIGKTWSKPEVAPFSGIWRDSEPNFTPDGKRMVFTSNRPIDPKGQTAQVAEWGGRKGNGSNVWIVDYSAKGWGEPRYVKGGPNDSLLTYNPSMARNGNLYFSSHRDGSGPAYQVFVAKPKADGSYGPAEVVNLGDVNINRMDPAIDPEERFIVFASQAADSLGSADLYISFKHADGTWGEAQHLGKEVNSKSLEHAPSLGPNFGELFVSSTRGGMSEFPKAKRDTAESFAKSLSQPLNGARNIWRFDISAILKANGIKR